MHLIRFGYYSFYIFIPDNPLQPAYTAAITTVITALSTTAVVFVTTWFTWFKLIASNSDNEEPIAKPGRNDSVESTEPEENNSGSQKYRTPEEDKTSTRSKEQDLEAGGQSQMPQTGLFRRSLSKFRRDSMPNVHISTAFTNLLHMRVTPNPPEEMPHSYMAPPVPSNSVPESKITYGEILQGFKSRLFLFATPLFDPQSKLNHLQLTSSSFPFGKQGPNREIKTIIFSLDGRYLAVFNDDGKVAVCEIDVSCSLIKSSFNY